MFTKSQEIRVNNVEIGAASCVLNDKCNKEIEFYKS